MVNSIAFRRCDAPARPRSTWPGFGLQQQTARTIAFGEQQETAAGFKVERFAACAERAEDDSAGRCEPLFGRPQCLFAFFSADHDQPTKVDPVLGKPHRVRRAFFREGSLFTRPEDRWRVPGSGEREGKPHRGSLSARPGRANLVQSRLGHAPGLGGKAGFERGTRNEMREGWTRTHVLYMF